MTISCPKPLRVILGLPDFQFRQTKEKERKQRKRTKHPPPTERSTPPLPPSREGRSPGRAMGLPALFSHGVPICPPTDLIVVVVGSATADHRCEPCRLVIASSRCEPLLGLVVVAVIANIVVLVCFSQSARNGVSMKRPIMP